MTQQQIPTFDPARNRQVVPTNLVVVVNAIDIRVSFDVGGVPGQRETRFKLEPGDQAMLPASYAHPIPGAGREARESILAMLTSVEAYPGGPRIQAVVPQDQAEATARAWHEAKMNRPTIATVMLQDQAGNPVSVGVPLAHAAPAHRPAPPPQEAAPPPAPAAVTTVGTPVTGKGKG
jgi:hypothetical protein